MGSISQKSNHTGLQIYLGIKAVQSAQHSNAMIFMGTCRDIIGTVQNTDLRDFFCISALTHGELVSLASRHKEKIPRSDAGGVLKLNSTAIHSFERTRAVRRSHLFCTSTWQVGLNI